MKTLADDMASAGKRLDDEETASYILSGLDIEYNPMVSAWRERSQSPLVSCSHSFRPLSNAVRSSPVMAQAPPPIWLPVVVVVPATTNVVVAAVTAVVDVAQKDLSALHANCVQGGPHGVALLQAL